MSQPTRLSGISYDQLAAYFVTAVTRERVKAFDSNDFGPFCVTELIAIATSFKFDVTAYTFMPDHSHFLVTASEEGADFKKMVKTFKQQTGFDWSKRCGRRLWQKGYFERVLRDDDAPLSVARYIIENPVRAGLVSDARDYPLSGSSVYSLEEILAAVQMSKGWRHRAN